MLTFESKKYSKLSKNTYVLSAFVGSIIKLSPINDDVSSAVTLAPPPKECYASSCAYRGHATEVA